MDSSNSFPPFDSQAIVSFDSADIDKKFANLPSGMVRRSNSVRSSLSICSRTSSPLNSQPSSPVIPTTTSPDIVILSLWQNATAAQIDFYMVGYETLYPSTQILLLRSPWPATNASLDNVLDVLTKPSEKPSLCAPSVMLHLFGHTGALNACNLLRAYRARTTEALNVKAIVSDTEPQITISDLAHSAQTPGQLLPLLWTFLLASIAFFVEFWMTSSKDANRIRTDLTNPLLLPKGVRKCFVFAEQDTMFSWRENEDGEAERRDYAVKRTSVDAKGRWTGDQERYWLGVEGVWEGI